MTETTDTAPQLSDYLGPQNEADSQHYDDPLERIPYSEEELLEMVAPLTAYGLPAEVFDDYHQTFLARALVPFKMLEIGDAAAELGLHKGAETFTMPAWVRASVGAAALAAIVYKTRKDFQNSEPIADGGFDFGGAAGG